MTNKIKPNKEWLTELSVKDGILFGALYSRATVGKDKYEDMRITAPIEMVIPNVKDLMFGAIREITPDANIYIHSRRAFEYFTKRRLSMLEWGESLFRHLKRCNLFKKKLKSNNIQIVDNTDHSECVCSIVDEYHFTYFVDGKKELYETLLNTNQSEGKGVDYILALPNRASIRRITAPLTIPLLIYALNNKTLLKLCLQ